MNNNKDQIRKDMLARRSLLTEKEIADYSAAIARRIFESRIYKECSNICIYQAFRNEVSCADILTRVLQDGKNVYVPVTDMEQKEMEFYRITEHTEWKTGAYGIKEPVFNEETTALAGKALILMPGLVFDHNRHRIGYGGGYYDRYLKQHPEHITAALCYDFQIVEEELPFEEHDILPDYIVTEREILSK